VRRVDVNWDVSLIDLIAQSVKVLLSYRVCVSESVDYRKKVGKEDLPPIRIRPPELLSSLTTKSSASNGFIFPEYGVQVQFMTCISLSSSTLSWFAAS
jgi:hypothetical protein